MPAGEITIWPVHSLQQVDKVDTPPPVDKGPRVNRRVVAAKRLEALNIDGVEQAAALAGPAREKRISKPTAKMAALRAASTKLS